MRSHLQSVRLGIYVPGELRAVFKDDPEVGALCRQLPPSLRRAWATYLAEAKGPRPESAAPVEHPAASGPELPSIGPPKGNGRRRPLAAQPGHEPVGADRRRARLSSVRPPRRLGSIRWRAQTPAGGHHRRRFDEPTADTRWRDHGRGHRLVVGGSRRSHDRVSGERPGHRRRGLLRSPRRTPILALTAPPNPMQA